MHTKFRFKVRSLPAAENVMRTRATQITLQHDYDTYEKVIIIILRWPLINSSSARPDELLTQYSLLWYRLGDVKNIIEQSLLKL